MLREETSKRRKTSDDCSRISCCRQEVQLILFHINELPWLPTLIQDQFSSLCLIIRASDVNIRAQRIASMALISNVWNNEHETLKPVIGSVVLKTKM